MQNREEITMDKDYSKLTITDCEYNYQIKGQCAICSNGQVVMFEKER